MQLLPLGRSMDNLSPSFRIFPAAARQNIHVPSFPERKDRTSRRNKDKDFRSLIVSEGTMKLKDAANAYILGDVSADDLPAVAVQALEDGYDSLALRQLALAGQLDSHERRVLFCRALEEVGLSIPSRREAGLAAARSIAEGILNGTTMPYPGAKEIWSKVYTRCPELAELKAFVGFASEYEDDDRHREEYVRLIVEECKALLSQMRGHP
jgi:hypothetical protein